jgi:ankyrin repeat protein
VEAFGSDIVNQDVLGQTMLMSVVCSGIIVPQVIIPILQTLLQHHVRLNSRHDQLGTFLHQMIANEMDGRLISNVMSIIQAIHGTESFNFKAQDLEGKTPLLLAVKTRNTSVVIALLLLQRKYPDRVDIGLEIADYEGRTPLMLAMALGCEEIVRLLLNQGANVSARDPQGYTMTHYAQIPSDEIENTLKSIHIEARRSIHAPQNWLYDENAMPILYQHDDSEPELILLSHDNMETLIEAANATMLTRTTRTEIRNQIKKLTSQEPQSVLQQCQEGQKQALARIQEMNDKLRQAAACGDQEKVEQYLRQGINCNVGDEYNRTALHFAVMRHERVKECLQQRTIATATISVQDVAQAMNKHANIADLLIQYGAEPLIQNSQGRSVLDILQRDKDSTNDLDKTTAKAIIHMLQTKHSLMLDTNTTSQPASEVYPK